MSTSPHLRSLWRNRNYLFFWGGQAISAVGGSVSELAFPLLVLLVTNSPAQAGIAAALRSLPATLFTLFAGALVDRWNRRLVMLCCDLGRALSLASIPLALWLGHLTMLQLYITAFVEGTLVIFFSIAHTASVAQVVAVEQFHAAIAQEELMEGTTSLLGPALSGALFALNAMLPFVTDAISYAVSIVTLLLVRTSFQPQPSSTLGRRYLLAEIGQGLRWMWQQPLIRSMNLSSLLAALVTPGSSLIIIVLARQQHASPFLIGVIFALGGVGAILGSLLAPTTRHFLTVGRAIIIVRWGFVLCWPLYAFVSPLGLAAVEFSVGFIDPFEDVAYFSYRLALIPAALRGRVISACRIFPSAVRPLGLALTGFLLQRYGPTLTLFLGWFCLILVALFFTLDPHTRQAHQPIGES